DGDTVFLDDLPEAIRLRPVRRALVDDERRAERQRRDDRPWAHHPAEVRHPEERIVRLYVKAVRHVLRRLDREAVVRVDGALRAARRAGGVDEHEGVFGLRPLRLALRRLARNDLMPPMIAPFRPRNILTCTPEDDDRFKTVNARDRF